MNNGKICISICAETAEDLIAQIKRAEDLADVIEIRFDCLKESDFDRALQILSQLKCKKPFLATFRPKSRDAEIIFARQIFENETQKQQVAEAQKYRLSGWEKISNLKNAQLLDFEIDILYLFLFDRLGSAWSGEYCATFSVETDDKIRTKQIIVSEHFFEDLPTNLGEIYDNINMNDEDGLRSDVIKIAVQSNDITDTIPIWKLLQKAKSENQQIIPIAMGEAGKWTRILGLAHGAFMTYAALDSGKETAPGQVSAKDLIEVYRAKELDENTKIYGIIGGNTSYSMSPFMQNAAFKFHELNSVFVPLQVQNLDEFIKRLVRENSREIELNFKGFSVTIPHKQTIIKHLDEIDENAKAIGAVNTVKIIDGKLHGYNTDAHGFITPLQNSYGDLTNAKVAVFGAGGAARACIYSLKCACAEVTIFVRNVEKAKNLAADFKLQISNFRLKTENYNEFDIIVNSTPLGTNGKNENESIAVAEQIENVKLVYDLVYNPFQTKLMNEADKVHVPKIGGMAMLVAQGMKQFEIWTGLDAPMKEMSQAILKRLG